MAIISRKMKINILFVLKSYPKHPLRSVVGAVVAAGRSNSRRTTTTTNHRWCALSTTTTTTTPATPVRYYARDSDSADQKEGDHIGGEIVRSGYSTSRKGHVYGGQATYFSCCGAREMGKEDTGVPYSHTPCLKGQDGMYHPGELVSMSAGSRRHGGGKDGGILFWTCCDESLRWRNRWQLESPDLPKGCTPWPPADHETKQQL
jgi:hypothetical protein